MELSLSDRRSKRRNAEDTDKGLSSTGKQDHDTNALFSCPNDGCTKVYQRYSGLENHLSFSAVRESLVNRARVLYHEKLLCDASATAPHLEVASCQRSSTDNSLSQGWTLSSSKRETPFNETQLENKLASNLTQARWRVICIMHKMRREKSFSLLMNF